MGLLRRAQTFQRYHFRRSDGFDRRHAGTYGLTVDDHRTRSALTQSAPELRSAQGKIVGQNVKQRGAGIHVDLVILAIHPEIEGAHWRLFYFQLSGKVIAREFPVLH
jgi:hypothetical protein